MAYMCDRLALTSTMIAWRLHLLIESGHNLNHLNDDASSLAYATCNDIGIGLCTCTTTMRAQLMLTELHLVHLIEVLERHRQVEFDVIASTLLGASLLMVLLAEESATEVGEHIEWIALTALVRLLRERLLTALIVHTTLVGIAQRLVG
jgi:hypothetical protein